MPRLARAAVAAISICTSQMAWAGAQGRGAGTLPSAGAMPSGTGAISGVVIDGVTGRPLEGAVVSLGLTSGGPIILSLPRTVTDAKGRFLFRDLAPNARYYLLGTRTGYASARYGAARPSVPRSLAETEIRTVDDVALIPVAANQWVSDLKLSLWRLGSVNGRVLDERGEPVVGVVVRGFTTMFVAGHTQYVASDDATTDDRGDYRLANLLPGKYAVAVLSVQSTVLASSPEGVQKRAVGELSGTARLGSTGLPAIDVDETHRLALSNYATPPPAQASVGRAYPALFYPGTTTLKSADLIEIGYGDVRRGVDFQLRPVSTVSVSGRVTLQSGKPPAFLLRLMPAGSEQLGAGSEAATTSIEPDGTFTFLNVPAGDYTLLAQSALLGLSNGSGEVTVPVAPGSPASGPSVAWSLTPGLSISDHGGPAEKWWGRMAVGVGDTDIRGITLTLHPTVSVHGRVVFAEGAPDGEISLRVLAQPANGDPTLGQASVFVTSQDKGTFTLDGLTSGRYLLCLNPAFRQGLVSVLSDGDDVRATGLDTSAGHDLDVVITVTTKTTDVSGTVHSSTGAAAAAVIAFPVDRARWTDYGWEPERIQSKAVDAAGAFHLSGLPEGEYFVVAVDLAQHDAWANPRFLEAAAAAATRVSLAWGERKVVALPLSVVTVK